MAETKKTPARKPAAKRTAASTTGLFTAEEKAAMKARAAEVKKEARAKNDRSAGEKDCLAAIAKLKGTDKTVGTKLHKIITGAAPDLWPKTWYGMPAYAKDGKIVCFFQAADKFKARYATLGFSDEASLDKGDMWPTSYAVSKLTADVDKQIAALVKKAVR